MNVFEPLFLLLALTTIGVLLTVVVHLVRGDLARVRRIARRWAIGAAIYVAVAIVTSAIQPRREYRVGDRQCFDDWCIAIPAVDSAAGPAGSTTFDVRLRLSNRARRQPMGERGTVLYLETTAGARIDPASRSDDVPFATILPAGGGVDASRRFTVPAGTGIEGVVYTHEGGFPIGWLIISEGGWFAKPPIVRLH